ncbi:MAG: pilus assembly protein TadG-related protein [Victivallaceae bacterium]
MAFSIMVFLLFFMLCVSVYAMSENIRQKIELQNACDNAAYSGAVVQADMLSRIAVLNRALSWTYMHTNRLQMDYLVGEWAKVVKGQHDRDSEAVRIFNSLTLPCHFHCVKGINYYASTKPGATYYINMMTCEDEASNVGEKVSAGWLLSQIDAGNNNMQTIMNEQYNIRDNINFWINSTVETVWRECGMSSENKQLFLGGGVYGGTNKATYFQDVNDEAELLGYAGFTASDMCDGVNSWWNLVAGQIKRRYSAGGLVASYWVHSVQWNCRTSLNPASHLPVNIIDFPLPVALNMNYDGKMVKATKVAPGFFGKAGSIVVAAKREKVNPFTAITGLGGNAAGFFSAFNVDKNSRDMWAVSAARAGVRLKANPSTPGKYLVQYPGESLDRWNLSNEDWDGVLLPVARAWNETTPGNWLGDKTSESLLSEVSKKLQVSSSYSGNIGQNMRH